MSIVSIKKRARADTLEVEHLLKEASHPNEALAAALDELSAELQWPVVGTCANGNLLVPLATWAKVVSTYCRDGFHGLMLLSDEPSLAGFVIGMLEELKTKEAFDTLLLLGSTRCTGSAMASNRGRWPGVSRTAHGSRKGRHPALFAMASWGHQAQEELPLSVHTCPLRSKAPDASIPNPN
jgi:hypothetical protein